MTEGERLTFGSLAISAVLQAAALAGIPFLLYVGYHKLRYKRSLREVSARCGLRGTTPRYLLYTIGLALVAVGALLLWPPPLELFVRPGSPQRAFLGLGFGAASVAMAAVYGFVTTGFVEEFLFRGLVAGSLSRRLPLVWANLGQALIFLAPHLLVLKVRPELWMLLPVVFVSALVLGWLRIKSGSIVGPWLVHASANAATCLSIAVRSAS